MRPQTKPHDDALVGHLSPAWRSLLATFSPANVLVVSNSAGTRKDSLLLQVRPSPHPALALAESHLPAQAESVSRNLGVPVLVHSDPKPSRTCARAVRAYFDPAAVPARSAARRLLRRAFGQRREDLGAVVWARRPLPSLPLPSAQLATLAPPVQLLVIGDRLTTDVILAHRLAALPPLASTSRATPPPLPILTIPILTTTLHAAEGLGTTFLRFLETAVVRSQIRKRGLTPLPGPWDACLVSAAPAPIPEPAGAPQTWWAHRTSRAKEWLASTGERLLSVWTLPPPPPTRASWNPARNWRDVMGYGSRSGGWAEHAVNGLESAAERARLWGALKSMGQIGRAHV